MDSVKTLIIGAGISGLSAAAFSPDRDLLILERDDEIGGYCKTVKKDGFVWDYSGHFFHFRNPEIERWLRDRMPGQNIRTVEKKSFISYKGRRIDFPFQKNIHQLPQDEFIDCLVDLYLAHEGSAPKGGEANFKEMLYARFGRGIAEKFLIPYNEKLYACDLSTLDRDAMGRFFPHANLTEIIRNMRSADNASYNASFTYPEGGAIEYVHALAREIPKDAIALGESVVRIDIENHVVQTTKREIRYGRLISSMPFDALVTATGFRFGSERFSSNRVLVFNLGFDKKGPEHVHWIYFPERERNFYRVGFYDNIFESNRMSLYVEIGLGKSESFDVHTVRERVLRGLRSEGIVTDHGLIAEHHVVMDPAYVHITRGSIEAVAAARRKFAEHDVFTIGRYGGWTYCSIEDNILEARALVAEHAA